MADNDWENQQQHHEGGEQHNQQGSQDGDQQEVPLPNIDDFSAHEAAETPLSDIEYDNSGEQTIQATAKSNVPAGLSWRDAALITDFSLRYLSADEFNREGFSGLVEQWGDPVDIARALYPAGGRIAALTFISDLYAKQKQGNLGFADGIQIVGTLGDMDPEDIRTIVKMVNALNPDGDVIRYRRNMATSEVAGVLVDTIGNLNDAAGDLLQFSQSLLAVWPGSAL